MSTSALVLAVIGGLVWLGVVCLFVLAWVDDRRRENEELRANSRAGGRDRLGAPGYAPAAMRQAHDVPVAAPLPPPPPRGPDPEPVSEVPEAEPEVPDQVVPAAPTSTPPSLWQIHKPLSPPRTEPEPPNGADAARPAAAGDGS